MYRHSKGQSVIKTAGNIVSNISFLHNSIQQAWHRGEDEGRTEKQVEVVAVVAVAVVGAHSYLSMHIHGIEVQEHSPAI